MVGEERDCKGVGMGRREVGEGKGNVSSRGGVGRGWGGVGRGGEVIGRFKRGVLLFSYFHLPPPSNYYIQVYNTVRIVKVFWSFK